MLLVILNSLLSFINKLNATLVTLNIENTDIMGIKPSFFALIFYTSKGEITINNFTIFTIVFTIITNLIFVLIRYRKRIFTGHGDLNENSRKDS